MNQRYHSLISFVHLLKISTFFLPAQTPLVKKSDHSRTYFPCCNIIHKKYNTFIKIITTFRPF